MPKYEQKETVLIVSSRIMYYHTRMNTPRKQHDGKFSPTNDMYTMMQYQLRYY